MNHAGEEQYVYFLRPVGMDGPVKIGCSVRPRDRLEAYAHLAPFPLEIAATITGDLKLEARFHTRFAADRSHHEWFRASDELTRAIDEINAGVFSLDTLPPKGKANRVRRPWSPEQRRGASLTHGLRWMEKRGVKVPVEIRRAAFRFSAGPYARDYNPHNPEDAALVEAFIAKQRASA